MTNRDIAADLACTFRVFPLRPYDGKDPNKAKRPAFKGWQAAASDDPLHVAATWPSDVHAPGLVTDGLAVIDFDVKNGGLASLEKLCARLPRTFTVRTPSGGFHYYYRTNAGRRLASRAYRVDKISGRKLYAFGDFDGVDIRAEGGLAVGPGATVDGGNSFYTVTDDAPIADLPDELADLADNALPAIVRERGTVIGTADDPSSIERAMEELRHSAPAVEGAGGDPHTIAVANSVMDFGVSPETCVDLMLAHWNDRCLPPWEPDDLAYKVASAARSRRNPIGCHNCDDAFGAIEGMLPEAYVPPKPATVLVPASRWIGREPDPPKFIIDSLAPQGFVTLLVSAGGRGKTTMALQMMACVASGLPFLGYATVSGKAAGIFCEDPEDGLHFRQKAICRGLRINFNFIAERLLPVSLVGQDATLWAEKKGAAALLTKIEREIAGHPDLRLLVIDGVSHVFAASEYDRGEVTRFLARLNSLASRHGLAVVLIAHESKSTADDDIRAASGSTAWLNAARSVLKLNKPREDQKVEPNSRYLRHIKTNYGQLQPEIACTLAVEGFTLLGGQIDAGLCERFLDFIRSGDRQYSGSPHATANYAPKAFCALSGTALPAAEKVMADLLAGGLLATQKYKSGGKQPHRLVVTERASACVAPADYNNDDAFAGIDVSSIIEGSGAANAELRADGSPDGSAPDGPDGSRAVQPTTVRPPFHGHLDGVDGSPPRTVRGTTVQAPFHGHLDGPDGSPLPTGESVAGLQGPAHSRGQTARKSARKSPKRPRR